MHGESSSSLVGGPTSTMRPQQHTLSSDPHSRSIVRQTPPSAFRTPSHHGRRSYHPQQQQQQQQQQQHSQSYNLYRQNFDSPFMSPPLASGQQPRASNRRPQPLVLDPQKPAPFTPSESASSTHSRSSSHYANNIPGVHKLFEVAARGIRDHASPIVHQNSHNLHTTPSALVAPMMESQAAVLARSAPQAGFLQKLGANIPEFKRRFFVLKPETNLYYYLSPNDTEPRGKIDLEGSRIDEVEHSPDGRYRFSIAWDKPGRRRIILEARSKEIGQEWMEYFENERVSILKDKVDILTNEKEGQANRIRDLERQIEHFKMVEKDRDGALEDAQRWKAQFERLDEALRLLTQRIRKPPSTSREATPTLGMKEDLDMGEEKKESNPMEDASEDNDDKTPTKSNHFEQQQESALLDVLVNEVEEKDIEELFDVPGRHFSALSNACQQHRESLRLASIEAATAVDDVHAANGKVATIEKRMEKAEKHLCKLWEENCTIRKTLKQKKREKRVLVREVKALQQNVKEMNEQRPPSRGTSSMLNDGEDLMEETLIGSDEERLIIELEEHVASSIRLHERLIAGNDYDPGTETDLNTSMDGSEMVPNQYLSNTAITAHGATLRIETSSVSEHGGRHSPLQPTALQSKLLSLIDDDSDSDSDDVSVNEYPSATPSVSSIGAEMGDEFGCGDSIESGAMIRLIPSTDSVSERRNPLLELDEEDEDEYYDRQSSADEAFTQSGPPKFAIMSNTEATSRLVCPLADVVATTGDSREPAPGNRELNVYHLTFYSRKIGIQFQKAPPAPTKPKGLLTDAMTADLAGESNGSEKTAAELRSVAAISAWANNGRSSNNEEVCQVATPEDIVLVCGFQDFDDSGMNQRPKLGARLVAFDGISVEIGQWTFDGIRKAIKSRGRPLTLSFRNDFLTTEQRAVLTKAVMEVDAKRPLPRPTILHGVHERPPSTTPSINSALSHETDYFVNECENQTIPSQDVDLSANAASITCCDRRPFGSSHSISAHERLRRLSSSTGSSTHRGDFRSFSEAGTSSVLSATLAPLVANLMKGVSDRKEKRTPGYLQRQLESSLENTPQHQDFQSNLL